MHKKPPLPNVEHALDLDGSSASIKQYYAKWSKTYDSDLAGVYTAPKFMVELLSQLMSREGQTDFDQLEVMDVGCGTGDVGQHLAQLQFKAIDGVDISPEMVEQARLTRVFREVQGDVDINCAIHPRWRERYDIVTCCGVFTLGHVQPQALVNVLDFAKVGGLVLTSTRTAYYDQTEIGSVHDELQSQGRAVLLDSVRDGPYTNDSDAHYWVFRKTG